jgi:hypothetical protein
VPSDSGLVEVVSMQSTVTCWIPPDAVGKFAVGVKTKFAVAVSVAPDAGVVSVPGTRVSTVVGMLRSSVSLPETAWISIVYSPFATVDPPAFLPSHVIELLYGV